MPDVWAAESPKIVKKEIKKKITLTTEDIEKAKNISFEDYNIAAPAECSQPQTACEES